MKFDWSDGNDVKCEKRVSIGEIEQLFQSDPTIIADVAHSGREERFIAVGAVLGRPVHVVFTERTVRHNLYKTHIGAIYAQERGAASC